EIVVVRADKAGGLTGPSAGWLHLVAGTATVGLVTCVAWLAGRRLFLAPGAAEGATAPGPPRPGTPLPSLVLVARAALITVVGFFQPLRKEFWAGSDDAYYLDPDVMVPWNMHWEKVLGRPMCFWAGALARMMWPGRVEVYLYQAAALCLANSLLLAAILRRLA